MASFILKDSFHGVVAESVYKEIINGVSKYYYYLGRSIPWQNESQPEDAVESTAYEREVRENIITVKEIKPTEISYVIPRVNWKVNEVYDQYDDQYSTDIQGLNLVSGGADYTVTPCVYIGSTLAQNWIPGNLYFGGELLVFESRYYLVEIGGISSDTGPTHSAERANNGQTTLRYVTISDGGGFGATAICTIQDGKIIATEITNRGFGYTSIPSIHVISPDNNGSGAQLVPVITFGSRSRVQSLEQAVTYVLTDDFNVYQCLDNNNGVPSTIKPSGTEIDTIRLDDGYIWKFLYTIPVSLKNRFLTSSYIPVTSALSGQFYSGGAIQNVTILNRGNNYSTAKLVISGDGYLQDNPVYVIGSAILNRGAGYVSPTVEISPPFSSAIPWVESQAVRFGVRVRHLNKIYNVIRGGVLDVNPPIHRLQAIANGTAILSYIGEIPNCDTIVTDGEITDIVLYGNIAEIDVINGGFGYVTQPSVYINGDGSGALATAIVQNSSIQHIIVNDVGDNYTTAPTIVIGDEWVAEQYIEYGQQYFYEDNLYTVTLSGTTGTEPPIHTLGEVANGTSMFSYAGTRARAEALVKYGAGYSAAPTVSIVDGSGSETEPAIITLQTRTSSAKIVPVISYGEIEGVNIINSGIGYTTATITVLGDGQDAELVADLSIGDINSLQSTIELLTVDGQIVNIPVVSAGYGYGNAEVIITGDGVGATAEAVIVNGRITKINVTNFGQGYRKATAKIVGNGFGAIIRPIIAPFGGFGKQAVKALNARSLMFSTNIFVDKNQGFDLSNDYRQVGIIKNLNQFDSNLLLSQQVTTPCWTLNCGEDFDMTIFAEDSIITRTSDGSRFRIVSTVSKSALVLSMDNAHPQTSDIFIQDTISFICTGALAPNVDKYSGDMLLIDNKLPFIPSSELQQRVTLRSVLKF